MGLLTMIARLGLNAGGFEQGLKRSRASAAKFGGDLERDIKARLSAAFGATAVVTAAQQLFERAFRRAGELKDQAEQLRLTTDEVQIYEQAMLNAGLSMNDFRSALESVSQKRREAAETNKELRKTFADLGITLDDLQNPLLRDVQLLERLARVSAAGNLSQAQQLKLRDLVGPKGARMSGAFEDMVTNPRKPQVEPKDIETVERGAKGWEWTKTTAVNSALRYIGSWMGFSTKQSATDHMRNAAAVLAPGTAIIQTMFPRRRPAPMAGQTTTATSPVATAGASGAGPLYEDKIAQEERKKLLESEKDLRESIWKLAMSQATNSGKELLLQRQINELLGEAAEKRKKGDAQSLAEANRLEAKANALREQQGELRRGAVRMPEAMNRTSVGGILGQDLSHDMNRHLGRIEAATEEIARNTMPRANSISPSTIYSD